MDIKDLTLKDIEIIRGVAKKQYEYSQLPIMKERIDEWYKHNSFQGERPMIHLEMRTFEHEIIPNLLRCESELGREIETELYRNFLNYELFDDDMIVPDHFKVEYETEFKLFGININKTHAKDSSGRDVGYHFEHVISDLYDDYEKLGKSEYSLDKELTLKRKEFYEELFGDILPVKLGMNGIYAVPTQKVVHLMGMENMLYSMYDYPDEYKEMMDRIANDYIEYYKFLEKEGVLLPNNERSIIGQGTLGYTKELPGYEVLKDRTLTTKDIWGFMDSQESVGISPEMFNEFIFPCYEKIAKVYGLLSYGCCEPVDPIWDQCISKFDNLRKVSISPWCNEEVMGEKLRGKNIIFHRKPSPNYLGVGEKLDEEAFKEHLIKTLKAAKGCTLEFTQRDVYTINNDIDKARRYVEIIRQTIDEYWNN